MNDPVDALILDLLEWLRPRPRPYAEVLEIWRTSCPRLPVWEEANARGYVNHEHELGHEPQVLLTKKGQAHLEAHRSGRAARAVPMKTLDVVSLERNARF